MGSTNPLRDVTIQVAAEAAVCPLIQRQQVTIKKKYAIVVACKVSGQGINKLPPRELRIPGIWKREVRIPEIVSPTGIKNST